MVSKPPNSGTLTRGLRLGKLGLSLTGSYLGYQAQNLLFGENEQRQRRFHKDSSRKVRQELGSLKGAAMKLGQLLSLQTPSLPEEVTRELAGLQMQAPPMHPTLARAQFKASLGKYPEEVFRDFDVEPFAAASLGQVHRAVTRRGEEVAVKIQYPAIRTAIENDFRLLRSATLPARITGHMPQSILNEVQRGFLEETDYLHEAKNIEFFSQALGDVKYLTVPKVLRDTTTDRVLTMSFVEGEVAGTFLDRNPPAAVRDLIGERLVELFYYQLHHLRALHADHHPGNYLFQSDGRIGLVDFGCVKRISFDASALIHACTLRSWRRGNKEAQEVLALILGPQAPFARARKMLPTLEVMANTLFPAGNGSDLFVDFGKGQLLKILGEALKRAVRDKVTNPEFAFVSRAEMGLYSLLHSLNAKVNPTEIWRRVQASGHGHPVEDKSPRPAR
jgi:predicted unusual protein kinase regulating ubiquinone biosynthesis (AarF/ABC1/UbiB family)